MTTSAYRRDRVTPRVAARRLWAGGAATATIAALIAVVGISLCRGVFGVPVPVPTYSGGISEVACLLLAAGAVLAD